MTIDSVTPTMTAVAPIAAAVIRFVLELIQTYPTALAVT
jgi:hypothetical protein